MTKLPVHLTQFIGRQRELQEASRLLADPTCHLLTLVGSGGIGKTRLAIQIAQEAEPTFANGAVFVSLQSVGSADFLIPAIADALDFSLSGQSEPLLQLGNYLADKAVLLVLDNFEQLLEAATVLAQLLQMAPNVTCLVTSRERLNVRGEWAYTVTGLIVPHSRELESWQTYDAVTLFVERARQVRWDFSLAEEAKQVIRICQLTDGMPLALELAAAWLRTLTCADIMQEIQQNLDFLTTAWRDMPERHRSVRAVFAYSWQTLTYEEQQVFARLSVFHGGCQREAAETVADANMVLLTSLVDKSLLRVERNGRYQIHELLRQFAAEQLATFPELRHETQQRHAHTFARFLSERFVPMTSGRQRQTVMEVAAELDNVRAAWQWCVSQQDAPALQEAATALHTFYQYQGRFREGARAFQTAVTALQQAPSTTERDCALALLLTCSSWLDIRFGQIAEATEMAETAVALYDKMGKLPPPGAGTDPLTPLALLAVMRGDNQQGTALAQQAWQRAEARQDRQNMAYAGSSLISAALNEGDLETAHHIAQETVTAITHAQNRWYLASVYNHLGKIMQLQGDLAAARQYHQAGLQIREEFEDTNGMAIALAALAEIAIEEKDFGTAQQLYQQTLAIYRQSGDRGGVVQSLQGMGVVAAKAGNRQQAYHYLWQSLDEAHKTQLIPLALHVLADFGVFLTQDKANGWGTAVLDFVQQHSLSTQTLREQVGPILQSQTKGQETERPFSFPATMSVNEVVHTLQANLSEPQVAPAAEANITSPISYTPSINSQQKLIEPLSEREIEVLNLLAAGLKNREIASELTVALSTVKTHVNNIYSKLGVSSRVQAVSRAQELNLLNS